MTHPPTKDAAVQAMVEAFDDALRGANLTIRAWKRWHNKEVAAALAQYEKVMR